MPGTISMGASVPGAEALRRALIAGSGGRGRLRSVPGRCRRAGQSGGGPGGAGGALRRDGRPELDGQHQLEDERTTGAVARRDDARRARLGSLPPQQCLEGLDSERTGELDERPLVVSVVECVDRPDSERTGQFGEPRYAISLVERLDGRDSKGIGQPRELEASVARLERVGRRDPERTWQSGKPRRAVPFVERADGFDDLAGEPDESQVAEPVRDWGVAGSLPAGLELPSLETLDIFFTQTCAPADWRTG